MTFKTVLAIAVLGLIQYLMHDKAPAGFIVLLDIVVLAKVFGPKRAEVVGHSGFSWIARHLIMPTKDMIKRRSQARKVMLGKKVVKVHDRRRAPKRKAEKATLKAS